MVARMRSTSTDLLAPTSTISDGSRPARRAAWAMRSRTCCKFAFTCSGVMTVVSIIGHHRHNNGGMSNRSQTDGCNKSASFAMTASASFNASPSK
jgi:hypothetical protein